MKSSKIRAALNPRRERGPDLDPRRSPERPPEVGADISSNELRLFGEHSQAFSTRFVDVVNLRKHQPDISLSDRIRDCRVLLDREIVEWLTL